MGNTPTPALNPGNMAQTVDSNNIPSDFESSMAASIEAALNALLAQDSMNTFNVQSNTQTARDRRRILIAIAQGVVSHLKNNPGAFVIQGTDSTGGNIQASITSINVTNPLSGF
jgi:hypothetical protein